MPQEGAFKYPAQPRRSQASRAFNPQVPRFFARPLEQPIRIGQDGPLRQHNVDVSLENCDAADQALVGSICPEGDHVNRRIELFDGLGHH